MHTYFDTLSADQLSRLYRRVYDRMTAGLGYQPYGIDRRTMRILHPHLLAVSEKVWEASRARAAEFRRTAW